MNGSGRRTVTNNKKRKLIQRMPGKNRRGRGKKRRANVKRSKRKM